MLCAGVLAPSTWSCRTSRLVNLSCTIGHEARIGVGSVLFPLVSVSGGVTIGDRALIGTGANILQYVSIGDDAAVGAGAVVVKDVESGTTVAGVPARMTRRPMTERIYLSPPFLSGNEQELVAEAIDSNWIAPLGPHVEAFEAELASEVGVARALATSTGTAALHLALDALGVGEGDVVLAPSFTFIGGVSPIRYVGAEPWFVDSSRSTWNLDPELLEQALRAARAEGRTVGAVIAVDLFGQCADYGQIGEICERYEVPLIEDAAEALGATGEGGAAGSFGRAGILSFNGNKIITTSGGGALVSDDEDADRSGVLPRHAGS